MNSNDYLLTIKVEPGEEVDEADRAQLDRAFGYKSQQPISEDDDLEVTCHQIRCNICFERYGVDLTAEVFTVQEEKALHLEIHDDLFKFLDPLPDFHWIDFEFRTTDEVSHLVFSCPLCGNGWLPGPEVPGDYDLVVPSNSLGFNALTVMGILRGKMIDLRLRKWKEGDDREWRGKSGLCWRIEDRVLVKDVHRFQAST